MKKLLGIGLAVVGATVIASIYTMIKEENEKKERAAKILDDRKREQQENRVNESFRRMTEEMKKFHDDVVRRMERDI